MDELQGPDRKARVVRSERVDKPGEERRRESGGRPGTRVCCRAHGCKGDCEEVTASRQAAGVSKAPTKARLRAENKSAVKAAGYSFLAVAGAGAGEFPELGFESDFDSDFVSDLDSFFDSDLESDLDSDFVESDEPAFECAEPEPGFPLPPLP